MSEEELGIERVPSKKKVGGGGRVSEFDRLSLRTPTRLPGLSMQREAVAAAMVYSVCSSGMLLANKVVLTHIPTPACVTVCQFACCAAFVSVAKACGRVESGGAPVEPTAPLCAVRRVLRDGHLLEHEGARVHQRGDGHRRTLLLPVGRGWDSTTSHTGGKCRRHARRAPCCWSPSEPRRTCGWTVASAPMGCSPTGGWRSGGRPPSSS